MKSLFGACFALSLLSFSVKAEEQTQFCFADPSGNVEINSQVFVQKEGLPYGIGGNASFHHAGKYGDFTALLFSHQDGIAHFEGYFQESVTDNTPGCYGRVSFRYDSIGKTLNLEIIPDVETCAPASVEQLPQVPCK